jgi:hypothetical protein
MSALVQNPVAQHQADSDVVTLHSQSRTLQLLADEHDLRRHREPPTMTSTNFVGIENTLADQALGVGPWPECQATKTSGCHLEQLYRFYEDTVADSVNSYVTFQCIIIAIIVIWLKIKQRQNIK